MNVELRDNFRIPIVSVTIGDKQRAKLDCLVDTGFTGALAGFHFKDQFGMEQSSIGNADYLKNPELVPKSHWITLANGDKVETWKAEVLCNLENQYHETEIVLISVVKPQPVPLILGMSLLKACSADLSIHFSAYIFELEFS